MVIQEIRDLLFAEEKLMQKTAAIKGLAVGTINIGTAYSAYYSKLAEVISRFHNDFPNIQVNLCYGYSSELLEALNAHSLDLCIISKREGEHKWYPIYEDEMLAFISTSHPLAKAECYPISRFKADPYIETYPDKDIDNKRILNSAKIKPKQVFTTTDSLATYSMVEAGLGVCMNNRLNELMLSNRIVSKPLEPRECIEIGIAALENSSIATNKLLPYLLDYFIEEIGIDS